MAAEPPSHNWLELPRDVTEAILRRLGAFEILHTAQRVCTVWRSICKDPSMWRIIDMRHPGHVTCDVEKLCKHAVDLSDGGLVDVSIEYFGTNGLLKYISERSSRVRRLRFVYCRGISDEGLSEAAQRMPLLEELDLSYCSISKDALEVVGQRCPLLKSFKFNGEGFRRPHIECDEVAIAVAKNMPGLRHLQLFGNKLTDNGLEAILDGCPHLQSLDLRQCFNLSFGANLMKRCFEQIRNLRLPNDSTEDYEFDATVHDFEFHSDGSFDDDYPSGFSDVDFLSNDDEYYELSGGSDFSDEYGDMY